MSIIVLDDPKYPHNTGAVIRTASAYSVEAVFWTGDRMNRELAALSRIPREERMKGYSNVTFGPLTKPFKQNGPYVPVVIEVSKDAIPLPVFDHPANAAYIFGPEDGSVSKGLLHIAHFFVVIPTKHCLNLASAVATVLYDREAKVARQATEAGLGYNFVTPGEHEHRGWEE